VPDLFQLARLVDEQETAVVALVDTNTTRLFVTRRGFLEEVAGPHDDPFGSRQRNTGGLNHKQYQRRVENQREAFAREAAAALEELVAHEGATRVILAGDAVAIPLLHRALSPQIEPLIQEEVLRLDIRTPRHAVRREIAPILAEVEEEESHARADRLVEAVRKQGLGVIGQRETRDALEQGQGEVLVLAEEAPLDEQERNDLVRLASLASAEVDLVKEHEILQQMGGVGALLRYRPAWV
jgi:stalled ribosome rescue protein Dom34